MLDRFLKYFKLPFNTLWILLRPILLILQLIIVSPRELSRHAGLLKSYGAIVTLMVRPELLRAIDILSTLDSASSSKI